MCVHYNHLQGKAKIALTTDEFSYITVEKDEALTNLKSRTVIYVLICVGLWALIPVVSKLGQINLDNPQFLF